MDQEDYTKRVRKPLRHPRMSRANRAKQFGAFDPLTGFSQAIRDKELEMEGKVDSQTERITITPDDEI
ncbi:MAG: hypothetical protein IJS91_05975 [Bacteroidales bacterium]|nr:hypothetical protein [Bacteroidales bacterium]